MKPQRYAHRVAWAGNARQLGRRWRSYCALIVGVGCFVALFALWPHMPIREGLIGFTIGGAAALILLSVVRFDDPQVRGDLAEQWSAEAFDKVRGWYVTNGLTFPDGDLDHVVITPSGVLAVETKYRFHQPDKRRLTVQRRGDLDAAARAARKATKVLASKDFGHTARVTPVLVVWGKGAPDLPEGYRKVDDAYVLDGDHPSLWSHLFNAPLLPPDTRMAIHDAFAKYQQKQATWAEQHQRSLRSICMSEFWTGVHESRERRRAALAKRRALRHRHHHARVDDRRR